MEEMSSQVMNEAPDKSELFDKTEQLYFLAGTIRGLIAEEPERVAQVVKQWVMEG